MTTSDFVPLPAIEEEARALLLNRGIEADCDWLPAAKQVHRYLLSATALFIQLRRWEGERQFAGFVTEARHDFDHLRQEFDRVSFRFARAIGKVERLGKIKYVSARQATETSSDPAIDDHFRKLVKDLVADVSEDVGVFYRNACRLLVRGVLATRWTKRARDRTFSHMGFQNAEQETKLAISVLLNAAVFLYAGIWLVFVILPPGRGVSVELRHMVVIITLIIVGAIAAAVVPKLHWGFANAGIHNKTPVAFVAGAGLAALLFAVLVNLAAGSILIHEPGGAMKRLAEAAPYLHSAFMTAATLAWLVQDHRWASMHSPRKRQLLDALTLGGVWMLSSAIAQLILYANHPGNVELTRVWGGLVVAAIFGGVIGYLVPATVRIEPVRRRYGPPPPKPNMVLVPETRTQSAAVQSAG